MNLYKILETRAKKNKKTIILPESYDERVLEAAEIILKKNLAGLILIQSSERIHLKESKNLAIVDVSFAAQFSTQYLALRRKKHKSFPAAQAKNELFDPLTFSCLLLKNQFADAVVAGSVYSTGEVIRNGLRVIGLPKSNSTVSSFFLFTFPAGHKHRKRTLAYADSGVLPNPTAEQLSDIAIQTASNYHKLTGTEPRVAFLSFSTKGSAIDETLDKVIEAYKLTHKRAPKLICDGELQFDAAFVPQVAKRKNPDGVIKGDANVFIFPDLNSGNIAYKITERIGGATATGPIVQGLSKPVMDLSRGCTADDIVNMVTIASVLR
jgi:phosphate acetyltransferase